jgi:hypothetical protein
MYMDTLDSKVPFPIVEQCGFGFNPDTMICEAKADLRKYWLNKANSVKKDARRMPLALVTHDV